MSIFATRPALRWLVPAAVTVAVVGGGAAARTLTASAEPALPTRTAAQLLVDLQTASLDGLSGTVRTNAELGLPELPGASDVAGADLTGLVSGSRTLRVWYSGPDKARVAVLGTLGESDVIRNGRDVWQWDSRSRKAVHRVLGEDAGPAEEAGVPKTPQEAADLALKAVEPSTVVSTGNNARVAGRTAYELILAPRDTASLVGEVRLAIDSKEHVPLRVQVYAKGVGQPAYEVAFTQVSFDRPDDAQFAFTPPPGTAIEEAPASGARQDPAGKGPADAASAVRRVGEGWTTVVVAKMPTADAEPGQGANPGQGTEPGQGEGVNPNQLLAQLPRVSGDWGSGRLLTAKLFSVLITDDGRIVAGAVAPEKLYEAARG
jgi:outer membrane lipoprotein-sorting protein